MCSEDREKGTTAGDGRREHAEKCPAISDYISQSMRKHSPPVWLLPLSVVQPVAPSHLTAGQMDLIIV